MIQSFRSILRTTALLSLLAVATSYAGTPAGQPAAKAAPAGESAREGWPETRAGAMAAGWVHAFSTGEKEMKDFLAKNMAAKSLTEKGVPQRVERYRSLREKYGKLVFASVVEETDTELTVKLMSTDAELHDFIFKVQDEAPFKLVSVSIREGGHSFGGFHH